MRTYNALGLHDTGAMLQLGYSLESFIVKYWFRIVEGTFLFFFFFFLIGGGCYFGIFSFAGIRWHMYGTWVWQVRDVKVKLLSKSNQGFIFDWIWVKPLCKCIITAKGVLLRFRRSTITLLPVRSHSGIDTFCLPRCRRAGDPAPTVNSSKTFFLLNSVHTKNVLIAHVHV